MSLLIGDTGKMAVGPLKTFNFQTFQREISLGVLTLPTTEPATSQIIFTVQQSDLVNITPKAISTKHSALILASGKCVTAATISYRVLKNGVSITTASTTGTANQFWSQNHWRWYDVQVGDVLEVRAWSNQTDTTVDYTCLQLYPSAVVLSPIGMIMSDIACSPQNLTSNPTPTGAGVRTVNVANTGGFNITASDNAAVGNSSGTVNIPATSSITYTVYATKSNSFGIYRLPFLDAGAGTTSPFNNATQSSLQKQTIPSSITFREVLR